jgi:hypothetical protein
MFSYYHLKERRKSRRDKKFVFIYRKRKTQNDPKRETSSILNE